MTTNDRVTPTLIPAEPARLKIGDLEVPVPQHPLSHESQRNRQIEWLVEDPDRRILAPIDRWPWGPWIIAVTLFAGAGAVIVLGVMFLGAGGWAGTLAGLAVLVVGLALLGLDYVVIKGILRNKGPRRFQFDAAGRRQLVVDRRHGMGKEYHVESVHALSSIIGVQLIFSGYHHVSYTTEAAVTDERYYTYEMNLIFSDAQPRRIHLCTHSDWQWMRDAGQKLADFLGVPLVDQLSHGD